MTWIPLAAFIVAVAMTTVLCVRTRLARRTASALGDQRLDYLDERRRTESAVHTSPVALQCSTATVRVTEASTQHLRLLRSLLGVALQPADQWGGFDGGPRRVAAMPLSTERASGAKTNAETLAAAMHLPYTVGDDRWHAEIWEAATEQLPFAADHQPGG